MRKYEDALPSVVGDQLSQLDTNLRIFSDGKIDIWYAPLGERETRPEIWILGITPGWAQMKIAYDKAADYLRDGSSTTEAATARKPTVAFAGTMRNNLTSMLDELGLPGHMGIHSTSNLFGSSRLRTGSILKYPVFKNGDNYSGSSPDPLRHVALRKMIDEVLVEDLGLVKDCLIVPLGTSVDKVLKYCVDEGQVDSNRILSGFPHPSGGNGYRVRHFTERREALKLKLDTWFKHHQGLAN